VRGGRPDGHDRGRDLVGQPPGMRGRREYVVLAVPEQQGHFDVLQVKPPWRAECQRVVDPAVRGIAERLGEILCEQGTNADVGHDPPVRLRHLGVECADMAGGICPDPRGRLCQALGQRLGCGRRSGELAHIGVGHPREPVKARRRPWSQAYQHACPGDPVRQQGRAGERVRTPAGPAEYREPVEFKRVRDCLDIGHHVRHQPGHEPVGPAVAGPVEGDEPHAKLVEHPPPGERSQPAPRRSVQQEHRLASRVPRFLHGYLSAVGRTYKGGHRAASPQKRHMRRRTAVKLPML
jgi:hypothetical protein